MSIDVVRKVAQAYPQLLQTNTYESCFDFVVKLLHELNKQGEVWGLVGKTRGEGQHIPHGWQPVRVGDDTITGFSHDAIKHRVTGQVVDTLANASANSDPNPAIHGPAQAIWNAIPEEHWRKNNPYVSVNVLEEDDIVLPPVVKMKTREQLTNEVRQINDFYKSDLKRPGGLVIDWEPVAGSPYPVKADIEAIASWLYNLMAENWTVDQAKAKIRESSEWKIKNQNGG